MADYGMMTFDEFERQIEPVKGEPALFGLSMLLYQSNAMAGEAGEVCDAVKKIARDSADDAPVVEECGDVLFYMARLLALRGFTIQDAAQVLLTKLDLQRRETAAQS